jgi:excisionase family DNA binding protein
MTRPRVVIDFAPRGLSADEAARYIGVGRTTFEELVARRKMPRPKRIGARVIYDRFEVDACFSDLDSAPANRIDELLSGGAA